MIKKSSIYLISSLSTGRKELGPYDYNNKKSIVKIYKEKFCQMISYNELVKLLSLLWIFPTFLSILWYHKTQRKWIARVASSTKKHSRKKYWISVQQLYERRVDYITISMNINKTNLSEYRFPNKLVLLPNEFQFRFMRLGILLSSSNLSRFIWPQYCKQHRNEE